MQPLRIPFRARPRCLGVSMSLVAWLAFTVSVFPWGAGHDDVMRAVMEGLPPELTATFTPEIMDRAIRRDSHYPDHFDPFLPGEVGKAAVARLKAAQLKTRFDLHQDRGRAAGFIELVEALREGHPQHIALWIAAYSHVVADVAACNHDPVVHNATYGWSAWQLRLPGGGAFDTLTPLLDLAGSARDTGGGAGAFAEAISRLRLRVDQREAEQALVEIMLYGHEGAQFCSARGPAVLEGAAGWVDRQDAAAREKLWRNMAELGAWAVVRTLRDVEVALRLARSGSRPAITPAVEEGYRAGLERMLRERRLDDDALFAPILNEFKPVPVPGQAPAVGIVLEPTWNLNEAMLGFASRVQATAMARTLRQQGRPYATFDVRTLVSGPFPAPAQVPVMVVVATRFINYHGLTKAGFDKHLAGYMKNGGRVIWVQGMHALPPCLAALVEVMRQEEGQNLPVTDAQFLAGTLRYHLPGEPEWKVAHPPHTEAGWQRPFSSWYFDLAGRKAVQALVTLRTGKIALVVGAISADARMACLPVYALTPHLLAGNDRIGSVHEPALDAAGTRVLLALLDRMLEGPSR
jgi:hypothetical protein